MKKYSGGSTGQLFGGLGSFLRRCIFRILSVGPIPNHFAFIMDGNRRYAKKWNLEEGVGHKAGFLALMSILKYCYELGVKYVTIYAFSIENFKRRPDEVQYLMDLMLEKIEGLLEEESVVNQHGIRVYFVGNLTLLSERIRAAAEKVMMATANNSKTVLLICIAYTSCDEIVHAVQESCTDKWDEIRALNSNKAYSGGIEEVEEGEKMNSVIVRNMQESCKDESDQCQASNANRACNGAIEEVEKKNCAIMQAVQGSCDEGKWDKVQAWKASRTINGVISRVEESENTLEEHPIIKLVDIENHMYMAVAPDPDILIRSSGEARLSNFLLWQTSNSPLYSPAALWPEIGLWHVVWMVLNFQQNHSYLEKKKKQL